MITEQCSNTTRLSLEGTLRVWLWYQRPWYAENNFVPVREQSLDTSISVVTLSFHGGISGTGVSSSAAGR
jgi:hypothetical protein